MRQEIIIIVNLGKLLFSRAAIGEEVRRARIAAIADGAVFLGLAAVLVGLLLLAAWLISRYGQKIVDALLKLVPGPVKKTGATISAAAKKGLDNIRAKLKGWLKRVPDAVSQAARNLGIDLSQVRIENGVARFTVARAETLRPADIQTIACYLRSQGAQSVAIQAYVENPRLSELITNPRAVQLLLGNSTARVTVQGEVQLGNVTERLIEITAQLR